VKLDYWFKWLLSIVLANSWPHSEQVALCISFSDTTFNSS